MRRPLIPAPYSYILIVIVFGCLGIYALFNWLLSTTCLFCDNNPPIDVIQANAEIILPPSAHDIRGYTEGFREIHTLVRFAADPADLPDFLSSTVCHADLVSVDPVSIGALESDPEWWRPMDAEILTMCSGARNSVHHTIYVDESEQDSYIIYVSSSIY